MCRIAPPRGDGLDAGCYGSCGMCASARYREKGARWSKPHAQGGVTNCRVATRGLVRSPQRTTQMGRTPLGGCTCRIAPLHVVGWLLVVMDRVCHATSARRVRTAKFTQFHEPWERIPGGAMGTAPTQAGPQDASAPRTSWRRCWEAVRTKGIKGMIKST